MIHFGFFVESMPDTVDAIKQKGDKNMYYKSYYTDNAKCKKYTFLFYFLKPNVNLNYSCLFLIIPDISKKNNLESEVKERLEMTLYE